MSETPPRPPQRSWVAAVHHTHNAPGPQHAAVVIDHQRLLTCRHALLDHDEVWVAFPFSTDPSLHRARITARGSGQHADVAVLVVENKVPADVEPAPLRLPRPQDLEDGAWWAYGFPETDPLGDDTHGHITAAAGYGWVRLNNNTDASLAPGFSGGGLWSLTYEAVVGLVGQWRADGHGRALTLDQVQRCLPGQDLAALASWHLRDADAATQAAWGWSLETDPQAGRHWRPRARGVSRDSMRGWRFRGRSAALHHIRAELGDAQDRRRILGVTGSPGVGKSAVLARIVTTADAGIRAQLPAEDDAVRAEVGSVACAVHAQNKTALEVAAEIARAASAAIPERLEDFPAAMATALDAAGRRRFALVIDALDEAADPRQARAIATNIAKPLAEDHPRTRVVVGTRRRDDEGDLLSALGPAEVLDLDSPAYFAPEDLAAYAQATLQLCGDERPHNPYTDDALAGALAARIAELSGGNFLIAGLVAHHHGLHDPTPTTPAELDFPPDVGQVLRGYLDRLAPLTPDLSARQALVALAFAQAPGFTPDLWAAAIRALYGAEISAAALDRFARAAAANFLIETSTRNSARSVRLFHQALTDALLAERAQWQDRRLDEATLTHAFLGMGRAGGWAASPDYLLRSLPAHAARGGLLDELLAEDGFLLHADLPRLLAHTHHATTPTAHTRARLLRLTPTAATAPPPSAPPNSPSPPPSTATRPTPSAPPTRPTKPPGPPPPPQPTTPPSPATPARCARCAPTPTPTTATPASPPAETTARCGSGIRIVAGLCCGFLCTRRSTPLRFTVAVCS